MIGGEPMGGGGGGRDNLYVYNKTECEFEFHIFSRFKVAANCFY